MTTRVLIVGLRWPPETFLEALIEGLVDAGLDITVACSERPEARLLEKPGFRWLFVPTWLGPAHRRLLRLGALWLSAALRGPGDLRRMRREPVLRGPVRDALRLWNRVLAFAGRRWDAVYFPWSSAALAHLPLLRLGMPLVISCRGSQVTVAPHDPRLPEAAASLAAIFERASVVHCVSKHILGEARKYGLDSSKAVVIRPAVDTDFFAPAAEAEGSRREDGLRIVSTGSLFWIKGQELALCALRLLLDSGVPARLDLIGEGRDRQRILYTVQDLGLEENVRLWGRRSPKEVREHLRRADVFLVSSLSEGISNAALEAMSCAVPVVTTDCGGMREAIEDGREGLVVPVRNPGAMAAALAHLSEDERLRRTMGEAARRRVSREFTLASQIERFSSLFAEVPR